MNNEYHEKQLPKRGDHQDVLEQFLDCYLVQRNADKLISLVTEDIYSLGTGIHEVAHNKDEFRTFIYAELEQFPAPVHYHLDTCCEKEPMQDFVVFLCDVTTTISIDRTLEPIHSKIRLTAGFRKENGVFLAYQLHMSEASSAQQTLRHAIATLQKERRGIDRLTGLLNREPAELMIEKHLTEYRTGIFIFMDIDNFKLVNDMKGHPVGDVVLNTFAKQLREVFPDDSVIARFGGDEFAVFLPRCQDLDQVCTQLQNLIDLSHCLIDDELLSRRLGISAGIAAAPKDGIHVTELYGCADKAQYYAKQNGKGRYSFYNLQNTYMHSTVKKQLDVQFLRRIVKNVQIEKGAFYVEYEIFQKVCQFMERNAERMSHNTQVMLLSLLEQEGEAPDPEHSRMRHLLEKAVRYDLRAGDLMLSLSPSQIVVLLVNCDTENASIVAQRILDTYAQCEGAEDIPVNYEFFSIVDA